MFSLFRSYAIINDRRGEGHLHRLSRTFSLAVLFGKWQVATVRVGRVRDLRPKQTRDGILNVISGRFKA